ncbi:MAG: glyoxalase [Cellulomonas sp. 73-145]|uniref:VOC family protein n=1 Tax=Cellulomonas sp. 73-145 TaxID=1895739 RepID=UPI000925AB8A|nr:VOC family protein [Cellulomonas sp. 73-145]MBN9326149.1 VOC family protein [Cellulomonas sp.]OJV60903.1 MAG: glyoxalase [Cellulomonas sp. 73-145]
MLGEFPAMPVLAVRDMDRARKFYQDDLGFSVLSEGPEGVVYRAGSGGFLVYSSQYAGTNQATAVSFMVGDAGFADEVAALRRHGIELMTFDAPEGSWTDGVLDDGRMRSAWFSDPDGNILNIETMSIMATA